MREFRIWYPEHKRMEYSNIELVWRNGWECAVCQKYPKPTLENMPKKPTWMEKAVFMMYAGVKAKYNKKVFEGDILEYSFYNPDKDEPKHGTVVFKDGEFYLDNIWMFDFIAPQGSEMWSRQKVIGNIYQNPELLK